MLALIAFFALPTLASTPQPENAPAPTSEDTMFLGWQLLSDEELINIFGDAFSDPLDPNKTGSIYGTGKIKKDDFGDKLDLTMTLISLATSLISGCSIIEITASGAIVIAATASTGGTIIAVVGTVAAIYSLAKYITSH